MFIQRVILALNNYEIPYAIVGGYAVALHGAIRGTVDIDLVISFHESNFIKIEHAFSEIGLSSRLPIRAKDVFEFREKYVQDRNLIAWSFVNFNDPSEMVDIILTENLEKLKFDSKQAYGTYVNVISIDDLIMMKRKSGRAQDIEDIVALEKLR